MGADRQHRRTNPLRLHPTVARLLGRPDAADLFPSEGQGGLVEVTPAGVVVGGFAASAIAAADRGGEPVVVREDLADEDPAVIAGVAIRNLLGGSKDPVALGAAWEAFARFCKAANRPRAGYRRRKYERAFGASPVARRAAVVRDTFGGYSEDQLARFAAVAGLPGVMRDAFRAGVVPVRVLARLATRPRNVIDAVAAAVQGGATPAEAVAWHQSHGEPVPAARTCLRRLLRALAEGSGGLTGRFPELMYLGDDERAGIEGGRRLLDELLTLPAKGEALAAVLATYAKDRTTE